MIALKKKNVLKVAQIEAPKNNHARHRGILLLHQRCELGPTQFLQGREAVEVGFDGRLVGGRQVGQTLEGA